MQDYDQTFYNYLFYPISDPIPFVTTFPVEEGAASDVIGTAVISCLCVFVSLFVCLDLPQYKLHLQLMTRNMKR